jgi:predicted RNase H-like HicB family nuclease
MREVRVLYRSEPEGWWAESPDVPGYTAVGRDYGEVRHLTHEGLPDFVGEPLEIVEESLAPDAVKDLGTVAYGLSFRLTQGFRSPVFGDPMNLSSTKPHALQG